jgi:hypothetical protein
VLEREPAERSVELGLELARPGGSETLVRAVGGDEAVEVLESERTAEDEAGTTNGSAAQDGGAD